MPYYQSIKGRKYEYADEQPAGFKPIAPGKFPMFYAEDFGDIVGNAKVGVLKPYVHKLSRKTSLPHRFGDALRQLINSTEPGDPLQPVKIFRVGLDRRNSPSARDEYVIVFDNGVSLMAKDLEAVLNHPTMTIHGIEESHNVALVVDGGVVGVVAGAVYSPEHTVTLWESPQP